MRAKSMSRSFINPANTKADPETIIVFRKSRLPTSEIYIPMHGCLVHLKGYG